MHRLRILAVFLMLYVPAGLALLGAGSTLAMPGWSQDESARPTLAEQRSDQIRALHNAYQAALSELDWSVGAHGHATETLRQARELQIALRAEILNVMRRTGDSGGASKGVCPYSGPHSGKSRPVSAGKDAGTFSL